MKTLYAIPSPVDLGANDFDAKAVELGNFETAEGLQVGLYEVTISPEKRLDRNKVGLHNLMRKVYQNDGDAALIVFTQGHTWRFTYASELTIVNKETGQRERKQTDPKRYTYILGKYRHCRTAVDRFSGLKSTKDPFNNPKISISEIEKAFSVETLTKQFYKELFDWYQWALSDNDGFAVTYPNDTSIASDDRKIDEHIIRLITRLMFVWFIKQKNLVPDQIFKIDSLKSILKKFDPYSKTKGNYYNAILQNFFFATLNKPIAERAFAEDGDYDDRRKHYGIKTYFRNPKGESWFKISNKEVINIFSKVPFLNGGLFECLDKSKDSDGKIIYHDGFSREESVKGKLTRAFVPNCLFFDPIRGLIPLLEKYNFTIEESTPVDVEVALDPELLGKVFENLLGAFNPETKETARKQSGSFYTPREIVNYMVEESLIAYLNNKCPAIAEEKTRSLFITDNESFEFNEKERSSLISALKSVKILDPACGSGAFPMGVLNKMVDLLQKLEDIEADTPYEQKLHLIENCIYGIDIQTIAVQISKLRFFISLVSDQITNSKPEKNYGITPLPNLETKFVAANTLIGLEKDFTDRLDLGFTEIRDLKDQLWKIRSQHFSARNAKEKKDLRDADEVLRKKIQTLLVDLTSKPDTSKIERLIVEIEALKKEKELYQGENLIELVEPLQIQGALFDIPAKTEQLTVKIDKNKEERKRIDKLIKEKQKEIEKESSKTTHSGFEKEAIQLAKWDPYDQNTSSHFFDSEWMFDVKEGFDIVIGNPPYVQLQKNNGKLAKLFETANYKTFERTGDIYSLFYEKGWQLLKQMGSLCYITSNKWLRAGYGESTRKFFVENTNPLLLIDFSGQKVFEATVDTNILLFTKDKNRQQTLACIIQEKMLNNLSDYFRQNAIKCQFSEGKSWVILNDIELRIKRKVEVSGTALKDWDINIYRGILTGYNEAFVIDGWKRKELITEDPKSAEIIRPILRGRDIKRYCIDYADMWLINSHNGVKEKSIKPVDIDEYPAIKRHLNKFYSKLEERSDKGDTLYNLRNCAYMEDFFRPKIVWKRVGSILRFAYDESGALALDSTCFATGQHLKFLVAVLNSKIGKYLMKDSPQTGTGDLLISVQAIEPLKIPIPDSLAEVIIESLVDRIMNEIKAGRNIDALENETSQILYHHYNLDERESDFIECLYSL